MRAATYRVRQFVAAVIAGPLSAADQAFINHYLSPAQRILFERLPTDDQQHSVAVAHTLLARGWHNGELIQAALLHDVGKAVSGITLVHRVAIVLLHAFWPAGLQWLATSEVGWRRPFHVHYHHPAIGAQLAAEVGSSPQVVELIAWHQASVEKNEISRLLAALRAADEEN